MAKRGQQINEAAAEAFYLFPCQRRTVAALTKPITTLLTLGFNKAWCGALNFRDKVIAENREQGLPEEQNPRILYAQIHDDLAPAKWWLDTLIDELDAHQADAVSTVIPIKGPYGTTSTAIYTGDIWHPRRLTMSEVMDLPETFTADDVGGPLLLNTGLWVADITKPWADEVCFDFLNRTRRLDNGEWIAEAVPEDWLNSHRMNEMGCKLIATRKIPVNHQGDSNYPNDQAWGEWKRDETYYARFEKEAAPCS
jgi:hypothetical protein